MSNKNEVQYTVIFKNTDGCSPYKMGQLTEFGVVVSTATGNLLDENETLRDHNEVLLDKVDANQTQIIKLLKN